MAKVAKSSALLAAEKELAHLEASIAQETAKENSLLNRIPSNPTTPRPQPGRVNSISVPSVPSNPTPRPMLNGGMSLSGAPGMPGIGGMSLSGAPFPRQASAPIPPMPLGGGLSGGPLGGGVGPLGGGGPMGGPMAGGGPGMMGPPPTGSKDLPEPSLLLLRELWAKLGYEGPGFVEMQMEIGRELERADFGRFEREMLCNEVLALRRELNVIGNERNDMARRLGSTNNNLTEVVQAEERTFQALLGEREAAQRQLVELQARLLESEETAHAATIDAEKAAVKVSVLSQEIERLEHDRATAVIQQKRLEKRLQEFVATAKAAGMRKSAPEFDTAITGWTQADEDALAKKISERRLAAEEARLAVEEKRLAQEKVKMKMEKDRLANEMSNKNSTRDANGGNRGGGDRRGPVNQGPSRGGGNAGVGRGKGGGGGRSAGGPRGRETDNSFSGNGGGGGRDFDDRGGGGRGGDWDARSDWDDYDDRTGRGGGGNGNGGGRPGVRRSKSATRSQGGWDDDDDWDDLGAATGRGGTAWGARGANGGWDGGRQNSVPPGARTPGGSNKRMPGGW